jgi:type II secretory pathway pseudopilin PulG
MTIFGKTTPVQTIGRRGLRHAVQAFSLAELMIATGILGIGMIIVAMAFPVALDQSRVTVETTTSQAVFNEAVNKLKTQVKWTQLYKYINDSSGVANMGNFSLYDFGFNSDGTTNTRRYINFPNGTFPAITLPDLEYSSDNTYGWMAAVERINNQTYKFWIFVLREPTGILEDIDGDGNNDFKFNFRIYHQVLMAQFSAASDKVLRFDPDVLIPSRSMPFVTNTGQLFHVTDTSVDNAGYQYVKCDKVVTAEQAIAFPIVQVVSGDTAHVTRKNPVIAVFETVISY